MNFNPETFLNTQFDEVSDQRIPFPADDYQATIEKVSAASGKIGKGERAGEDWARLDLMFRPIGSKAQEAAEAVGLNGVPLVKYGIMLNLDENGKLLTGPNDNPNLGKLLNAVGLNQGNWMPAQLQGQTCIVKVAHRANPENGDQYAEVTAVAPLS